MNLIKEYFVEILLVLISVFLLVVLVAPYGFGFKVKSSLEDLIEDVSAKSGYHVEAIEYERNWFDTNVGLIFKDENFNEVYRVSQRIIHGPLYLGLLLEKSNPITAMVAYGSLYQSGEDSDVLYSAKNPVQFESVFRFNRDAEVDLRFPDTDKQMPYGNIRLSGMSAVLNYLNEKQQVNGTIETSRIELHNGNSYDLDGMTVNFNQDLTTSPITGDSVMSLLSARAIIHGEQFTVSQVSTRLVSKLQGASINYSTDINVGKLNLLNEQVTSLSAVVELTNVSNIAFDSILGKLTDTQQPDISADLLESAPVLFNASTIEIAPFTFYSEHGQLVSEFKMQIDKEQNESLPLSDQLDMSATLNISRPLFARIMNLMEERSEDKVFKANSMINKLVNAGYLESIGDKYQFQYKQQHGRVLVNNRLKLMPEIQSLFSDFSTIN